MKKEIIEYIKKNKLSPFNSFKTQLSNKDESFYNTKDAKLVHNKLLAKISSNFNFSDTSNIFNYFSFTRDESIIKERQKFFSEIIISDNSFLKNIKRPKNFWNPNYGIVVVTEDDKTYNELSKLGCPVKFLITQSDLESLSDYDIVQVIDCENFSRALETLPQSVFLDSLDEVYLERYVSILSGWAENLKILKENELGEDISKIVDYIYPLLDLLEDRKKDKIKKENIENALININHKISNQIKSLTVSGESLFSMLSKNIIPPELEMIIKSSIKESGLPSNLFTKTIPVEIDAEEMEDILRKQDTEEHTNVAVKIKKNAQKLLELPKALEELSNDLLLFDFISGIVKYSWESKSFAEVSDELVINEALNIFLDKAQPISFHLNDKNRCSILTGANSGGKTTLIEHIIQIYSLMQIGLPVKGNIKMPLFTEIYYFAKNKGSTSKGAFETLLTQMSKINPGNKTLILADEIESVTEPGVAGAIICASAEFFINKGCYLIIATHLGKEIQKTLPKYARIDGIEAKGLDENYQLIVDHNPVMGRLANSTPELIIEKMASMYKTDYYNHLFEFIKKK